MTSKNKCRICGKVFATPTALKQHMKAVHRGYYYGIRLGVLGAVIAIIAIAVLAYSTFSPPSPPISLTTNTPTTTFTSTQISESNTETSLKPASDFTLPEIDSLGLTGKMISLSQFNGKPVFSEFMSPLCGHCAKMTPVIKDLEERYGDRVVFISIIYGNASSKEFQNIASEFIRERGLNWIHVVDSDLKVFREYGVRGTPTYVILNKEHMEVSRLIGSGTTEEALEKALEKVVQ